MENGTKTEATFLPNGVQAKPADLETGTSNAKPRFQMDLLEIIYSM